MSTSASVRSWRQRVERHHVNTVIYLASSLLSKAASIFLIPLYTSRLTPSEYAAYGLCQTLYWIVPPLVTGSLHAALGRFYFDEQDPDRRDGKVGFLAYAIGAAAVASGLVYELVALFSPPIEIAGLDQTTLHVVAWTCVALPIAEIATSYFRSAEMAGRYAAASLSVFAVTVGSIAYLMLVRSMGLRGLLVGMLLGQTTGALFSLGFLVFKIRPRRSPGLLSSALRYSLPLIPHLIGTSLMSGADRWMLEYYGLRHELGLYTLAVQLTVPVSLVVSAWHEASSPRLLAAYRDRGVDGLTAFLPRIAAGFAILGAGSLVLIVAATPLLRLLVGARFEPGLPLIPWVGLGLVVGFLQLPFLNVLYVQKRTRLIPALTLSAVAVNVVLNSVLIPSFGVYGAILATGLAFAFRSILMFEIARRAIRTLRASGNEAVSTPSAAADGSR